MKISHDQRNYARETWKDSCREKKYKQTKNSNKNKPEKDNKLWKANNEFPFPEERQRKCMIVF